MIEDQQQASEWLLETIRKWLSEHPHGDQDHFLGYVIGTAMMPHDEAVHVFTHFANMRIVEFQTQLQSCLNDPAFIETMEDSFKQRGWVPPASEAESSEPV